VHASFGLVVRVLYRGMGVDSGRIMPVDNPCARTIEQGKRGLWIVRNSGLAGSWTDLAARAAGGLWIAGDACGGGSVDGLATETLAIGGAGTLPGEPPILKSCVPWACRKS